MMSRAATMSNDTEDKCASCGITGGDGIKLKNCTACKLVKYCSVECQRHHRSQHKRACKKRAAEMKDELLFKQPESTHLGDCPICMLPLPFEDAQDKRRYSKMPCCFKTICDGCLLANDLRQIEARLPATCPFCRTPVPKNEEEGHLNEMKRVKVDDPVALKEVGMRRYLAGDYGKAFEYWEKAAGLGDVESHYHLSIEYAKGCIVEQDMKMSIYHMEQAVIGGHVFARHNLGVWEQDNGNIDRAVKHFIIAANLGLDEAIENLKSHYARGAVSKEDFAAALRAHQAAVDATKSPQRDEAEAAGYNKI